MTQPQLDFHNKTSHITQEQIDLQNQLEMLTKDYKTSLSNDFPVLFLDNNESTDVPSHSTVIPSHDGTSTNSSKK